MFSNLPQPPPFVPHGWWAGADFGNIHPTFATSKKYMKWLEGMWNITDQVSRYGAAVAFNRYAWVSLQSKSQESIWGADSPPAHAFLSH